MYASTGMPISTSQKMIQFRRRRPCGYTSSGACARLALDERDPIAQARDRVGVDRLGLEVRPEPIHDVGDEAKEHRRVGDEELGLVVVADEGQPTLEHAALLDVGDLGREVVALDAVGVVEEVQ